MSDRGQPWNRCDICGKFIAFADFESDAVRKMTGDPCEENFLTLCLTHGYEYRAIQRKRAEDAFDQAHGLRR